MSYTLNKLTTLVALTLLSLCLCTSAHAADISADLSARETYVGLPITLRVEISNASKYDEPQIPDVAGLLIQAAGAPSRSTQISIINGRKSEKSSITYAYRITPQKEGTFTIPSITVRADGQETQTEPLQIVATKSETGDLMFVEIEGKRDSVYVGEALELTLKLWLRPYRHRESDTLLSEHDMWKMISGQTDWGPFADRIDEIVNPNRRPGGKEVLRTDGDGQERSYYLYEIDTTIYPQRPGKINGDDVKIIVNYPTAMGRSRDPVSRMFDDSIFGDSFFQSPFRSRLAVTSVRPITGEATVEEIQVKPVPTGNRPADYRGAVGEFEIVTMAESVRINAGDPITLRIGIAGDGLMDHIPPPPIAELPELTQDFKVPDEPLAGFVNDQTKLFTTTIRPRKAGITQIPAIPFSYFDPKAEAFKTVHSDPIAIEVGESETLALETIVANERPTSPQSNASVGRSLFGQGIVAKFDNFSGPQVLKTMHPSTAVPLRFIALFAFPPALVFLSLLVWTRGRIFEWFGGLRSPLGQLQRRLRNANHADEIETALTAYLQRRFGRRDDSQNSAPMIGAVRLAGQPQLAIELERLYDNCKRDQFAGAFAGLEPLKEKALLLGEQLQRELKVNRRQPIIKLAQPKSRGRAAEKAGTATMIMFTMAALSAGAATPCRAEGAAAKDEAGLTMTADQQHILLSEANDLYAQATATSADDLADSKRWAQSAAEKYQLLVDSGVHNDKLYFNLANAYLKAGETGRAIANYRRALRIDPNSAGYRANLEFVLAMAGEKHATDGNLDRSVTGVLWAAHKFVSTRVAPHTLLIIAFAFWAAVWTLIALGLMVKGRWVQALPWKTLSAVAFLVAIVSATSYLASVLPYTRKNFAVLAPVKVELRAGDGKSFDQVAELENAAGKDVMILDRRGDWVQIRIGTGQTGWVSKDVVEVI